MGDNDYEAEIRAIINNDQKRSIELSCKKVDGFAPYQDDYYKSKKETGDPDYKSMRIRKRRNRDFVDVLYSENEYVEKDGLRIKRSLLSQGKIKLFRGSEKDAIEFLKKRGFEYWFTVKKTSCDIYQLDNIEFAMENIEDLGWTIEIEGDGTNTEDAIINLWKKIKKLGVSKDQIMPNSIPKTCALKKGLL